MKIAIETERGLLVATLQVAGYEIYPINPKAVDRYRDRHHLARGKSDAADAMVLAHILRTDARLHRPLPGDSPAAQAIEVLARAHQDLVWSRQARGEPAALAAGRVLPAALAAFGDLTTRTALAVLAAAPTPVQAAKLDTEELLDLLAAAGRGRRGSEARRLAKVFGAPQLRQPPDVEQAMGDAAAAIITTITAMNVGLASLGKRIDANLSNTRTLRSTTACLRSVRSSAPGCSASSATTAPAGPILPAAAPTPEAPPSPASRARSAWCWPATTATSGFMTPPAGGPLPPSAPHPVPAPTTTGAAPPATANEAALRRLASKLIGQLHHCLTHRVCYDEATAWSQHESQPTPASSTAA